MQYAYGKSHNVRYNESRPIEKYQGPIAPQCCSAGSPDFNEFMIKLSTQRIMYHHAICHVHNSGHYCSLVDRPYAYASVMGHDLVKKASN